MYYIILNICIIKANEFNTDGVFKREFHPYKSQLRENIFVLNKNMIFVCVCVSIYHIFCLVLFYRCFNAVISISRREKKIIYYSILCLRYWPIIIKNIFFYLSDIRMRGARALRKWSSNAFLWFCLDAMSFISERRCGGISILFVVL